MADHADLRVALLSLHPRWADAILDGTKTVELRRQPPADPLSHIVIYATAPVSAIVGFARVRGVDEGSRTRIWNTWRAHSAVTRDQYRSYFAGLDVATAIVLDRAVRLTETVALEDVGLTRAPQNFVYLPDDVLDAIATDCTRAFALNA